MSAIVTVAILNWNGADLMRRFLPSVVATTPADLARVLVIDNGSDDDSLDLLARQFPTVEVMRLDKNYGFAQGYNIALDKITTPYAVLLNSDVEPRQGWLSPLVDYMIAHPDCAACQPKILAVNDPKSFEYAGAAGGFLDRNGYPFCRGRIFSTIEHDNGQYDAPIDVDWASGAALMVNVEAYRLVGGLDSLFFAHMEEIDLCWRLRLHGYSIAAVPSGAVYHLGGGSLAQGNPRKTYLNFRNNLLMLHKNLPSNSRRRRLFVRRLLDTLAWARAVVSLNFADAGAILRAHRDFRRMRSQMAVADAHANLLASRPNIIVDYYLRRKKTFLAFSPSKFVKMVEN